MLFALKTTKQMISTVGQHIEINRSIECKKFQLNNLMSFKSQFQGQILPKKFLQKHEIETRLLKVIHESELIELKQFQFEDDIRKKYNLDSLAMTALISSIEQQFNTILDPSFYEGMRTMEKVVQALMEDDAIL